MTRLVFFLAALALTCTSSVGQEFQRNYYERRSQNEAFDNGLANWETRGSVTVIPWEQLPPEPEPTFLTANQKYLTRPDDSYQATTFGDAIKLSGTSAVWQTSAVNGKSKYQLVICNARKRLKDGATGSLGWAGFGVSYYDAGWSHIKTFQRQVSEFKNFNPGFPPGYSQASVGALIPDGAAHAVFWLANDGNNTETYADDFALLNKFDGLPIVDSSQPVGEQFTQDPSNTNLVANVTLEAIIRFDDPTPADTSNEPGRFVISSTEAFWQKFGMVTDPRWGRFVGGDGVNSTGTGAYWQDTKLEPNTNYELDVLYQGSGQFSFGVDTYDQNWQFIEKHSANGNDSDSQQFETQRTTVSFRTGGDVRNASVWIWYGPLNDFTNSLDLGNVLLRPVPGN